MLRCRAGFNRPLRGHGRGWPKEFGPAISRDNTWLDEFGPTMWRDNTWPDESGPATLRVETPRDPVTVVLAAYPAGIAVGVMLFLPDRQSRLQLVDNVAAG